MMRVSGSAGRPAGELVTVGIAHPRTPPSALCCREPEPRRLARRLHRLTRARSSWSAVELVRYVKNDGIALDPGNLRRGIALGGDMDPLENHHKQRRWLIAAIVVVVGILIALFFLRRGKDGGCDAYRPEAVRRGNIVMSINAPGPPPAVTTGQRR